MEKTSRTKLLDSALDLLGRGGPSALTVRAAEDVAGLPHGSVRHHFGDRAGLVRALFDHLADRESAVAAGDGAGDPAAAIAHWLGPGRDLTLARYELFLMAARDPELRAPLVHARDRFVALAAQRVGAEAAPAVVAALDGLVFDALVRGARDAQGLATAVARLTAPPHQTAP
ncbi:MAG TPA: TetR family transcriptional regulator [Baekduia sp.]|nr:TetR family transcriptional regulator [Baekduia sp.]